MEIRSYIPFPHFSFTRHDTHKRPVVVAVARATFSIRNGEVLRPTQEQKPVAARDGYYGEAGASSLLRPSDLAISKPRSDVFINALAHAPDGKPAPMWLAEARVGMLSQALKVFGKRAWRFDTEKGWLITDPKPTVVVPLRYENAYGGSYEHGGETIAFPHNPLGSGYVVPEHLAQDRTYKAHQIEAPGFPVTEPGQVVMPAGFGPVYADWRIPRPDDSPYASYNAAHPNMVYPGHLQGNEEVVLQNLTPDGRLDFRLPSYRMLVLVRYSDGGLLPAEMKLDTLAIDVPAMEVYATWRVVIAENVSVRVLEFRMEMDEAKSA
ncbi:DUF2169 domain-containing protein [Sulfidibacter corallicola]|uniref:DUF2169 domain-containing protein n=1 Tax=Sulfidibacter corallicola TaxID=2818388 RepID=A0A8A4TSV8_SULCO|nr:DUF2169 domain-containing protein [Sulfidibacter corallicola]QTD52131.1 DUF2169 domain-containing protein [Sulfidibacter corallicola]